MQSDDILTLPPPSADARLNYGNDPNHFADLRLPRAAGPHPVVVNIHGGFWRARYDLTHAGHLCAALTKAGFATWNLEYRRVGNPGGGWPGTFEDITHGFQYLQQVRERFHLDLSRTIVMGHSAGGQLALCLAAHQPTLRGAFSLAGVLDMKRAWELKLSSDAVGEFLGGPPQRVAEHYREASPIELPMPAMPQRLLHGVGDGVVPVELSIRYRDRKHSLHENVQLTEVARTGHFELIDPRSAAFAMLEASVKALLQTQPPQKQTQPRTNP
jgi:acetyl esterase/lipase